MSAVEPTRSAEIARETHDVHLRSRHPDYDPDVRCRANGCDQPARPSRSRDEWEVAMSDEIAPEARAEAGEVWQEVDNVLLLCVVPGVTWQDFNGARFDWNAPTVARPLRRLLDRAGNLVPERTNPPASTDAGGRDE